MLLQIYYKIYKVKANMMWNVQEKEWKCVLIVTFEVEVGSFSGEMNEDVRQTMDFAMRYSFPEQNIVA